MKTGQFFAIAAFSAFSCAPLAAQDFSEHFSDSTLRLDYVFAGNDSSQYIFLDGMSSQPRWYGRRTRLAELPLRGNGQITMRDRRSDDVIYRQAFSTLFQEWLSTPEAAQRGRSFENVFLVPYPKTEVDVTVELQDNRQRPLATLTHTISPDDALIRETGLRHITPYTTLQSAADTTQCIHIAFVAEGYDSTQTGLFLDDARAATEAIFAHEPFKVMRDRFNVIAVMPPSADSGTSIPTRGEWRNTALGSHFSTFYIDRYLTTTRLKHLHDILAGTPYEHIIILVNTDEYGGGGIFNFYNLAYTRGDQFLPVVVHEFGHSFGGLADEYDYGDGSPIYFPDVEPWEPNLTTRHDFSGKWESLVEQGVAGLVEGGGYQRTGVWRGADDCRMRTNATADFCVVCRQALERIIKFYTE